MTITQSDENRGLYAKYVVTKADGTPVPGPLFILRYAKDPHARVALTAYADSCDATHPLLAIELRAALAKLRMTKIPVEHQPANPDVWRMRFSAHVDHAIRAANLTGTDLDTAAQFEVDLTRAFTKYLNSSDDARRRRFLAQINTIAARAYAFLIELDHPELRVPIENILFDLGGLAEVLTRN